MKFDLEEAIAILERTPSVLRAWLQGLPEIWTHAAEGGDTWSAFDIVGHLIHGERTDWIPRLRRILEKGESVPFEPFDRFAQEEASRGKTLAQLIDTFEELRAENLDALRELRLTPDALEQTGTHPELGRVTATQLLATWTTHDLGHLYQMSRTMAGQYKDAAGPWVAYLRVLQESRVE